VIIFKPFLTSDLITVDANNGERHENPGPGIELSYPFSSPDGNFRASGMADAFHA